MKQRAAKSSQKRAQRRMRALEDELADVRRYHGDTTALISFVVGRLLLVNLLWIAQEAVDYLLGLISNGTYAIEVFSPYRVLVGEELTSGVSVLASGIGAVLLLLILNVGIRTYRTWRRAQTFTTYEPRVLGEIGELKPIAAVPPA